MSNADMGIIPQNFELPLGASVEADGLDKAMVWDESRQAYRLINDDLARVKKLTRKPTNWAIWGNRIMVGIGAIAIIGCLAFTATYFARKAMAPVERSDVPSEVIVDSAVAAPQPLAADPQETSSVDKPTDQAPAAPMAVSAPPSAKEKVSPAPAAKPKAESSPKPTAAAPAEPKKPAKREEAPAAAAPKPVATPTRSQAIQDKPAPVKVTATESAAKAPAKPSAGPTESTSARSWAIRVENNGVLFSGSNRLFRVGEVLPNGERLVDVDEGSSTYATDRGIRQIRSSSLR